MLRKEQYEGKENKNFDLYVIDFNRDNGRTTGKSNLLFQLEKMFENEEGCDKKHFWTVKDLKSETEIEVKYANKNFLNCINQLIQHISSDNKEICSVIFI